MCFSSLVFWLACVPVSLVFSAITLSSVLFYSILCTFLKFVFCVPDWVFNDGYSYVWKFLRWLLFL